MKHAIRFAQWIAFGAACGFAIGVVLVDIDTCVGFGAVAGGLLGLLAEGRSGNRLAR